MPGVNDIIGAGMGLILGGYNDDRQYDQQERLTQLQTREQRKMMELSQKMQYDMWLKTNYGGQMEQMIKAGLNPGLIYGMKGGGGITTGNPTANVTGATALQNPGEIHQMMGMGLQSAMTQAQIDNLKANTEKTKVEAGKIGGVDTQKVETEISKLIQETTNEKVKQGLLEIEKYINNETKEANIDIILSKQAQEIERLETMERENMIGKATQWAIIDEIRAKAIGQALQNSLTIQQTEQSKEQVKKWAQEIAQGWEGLSLRNKELKVDAIMKEVQQTYEGRQTLGMKITTHNVKEIADQIDRIMGISREDFKKK